MCLRYRLWKVRLQGPLIADWVEAENYVDARGEGGSAIQAVRVSLSPTEQPGIVHRTSGTTDGDAAADRPTEIRHRAPPKSNREFALTQMQR